MPLASKTPENSPVLSSQIPKLEYAQCVELLQMVAPPAPGDTTIRPALEMQGPEDATLCTGPDLQSLQISEVVKTAACSSMGTSKDPPETIPRRSQELHPAFSEGPSTLVHVIAKNRLPEDFDLDQALSRSGITLNMVPNIVEKDPRSSYDLVVATSRLSLLSEKLHDFEVVMNYNPFKPAEADVRIHGRYEADKIARVNSLNNAVEAIRNGWGPGPAECYQNAAKKVGLQTALEQSILNWDIQHSNFQVLECLTKNLLFFCVKHYDIPPAHDLFARDQNDWLQPFQDGHTSLSELLMAADIPIRAREQSERQAILLFRSFLELSGGEVDCRRHSFEFDYTITQNASLCARLLGVSCSRRFGRFDPQGMQDALSKSKLFAEASIPAIPDVLEWNLRMMAMVPVGFPDNYLNLPSQLLCGFGAQQINQLRAYFEHTYQRLPPLRKQQNNILLLLSWSHTYHGQTLKVLSDWAKSEESLHLYQRLIEDLWLQQTPEDFTLTLVALLCRERLLPYTMDDTAQPVGGSYLTDLDAILNGHDISSRRTVFEQMVFSLVRVLYTIGDSGDLLQLLAEVLDKKPSLLTPLDGVSDQYCARKIRGHTHNEAFEEAREWLLESITTMFADTDWTMIPRYSPRLVSVSGEHEWWKHTETQDSC